MTEFIEKHPKLIFWIRFVFWVAFAVGIPFGFIAWRYELFTSSTKISITGWGFLAIVILAVFAIYLVKYIYRGLKAGMLKQCVSGIFSLILPLCAFYALIAAVETNITLFKQALGCTILSELCALPINPLPVWAYEQQKEIEADKRKNAADYLLDGFFSRKSKNDK